MPGERLGEALLPRLTRGLHGGEDPAARGVELLVARPAGPQLELRSAVAGEAGVGVAVDEPGDRGEPPRVELDEVGRQPARLELGHRPDARDAAVDTQHVRVLDDLQLGQRRAAQRRRPSRRGDHLREVADEQRGHDRAAYADRPGRRRPCSRAAVSASS